MKNGKESSARKKTRAYHRRYYLTHKAEIKAQSAARHEKFMEPEATNALARDETPERDERIMMKTDLEDTGELGEADHDERTIRSDED